MEVSVRPPKHHYDVTSDHCVSKLAYFVEYDIGYQPSKFQCSRMSGSNFMEQSVELNKPPSGNRNCLQWQRFKLLGLSKS